MWGAARRGHGEVATSLGVRSMVPGGKPVSGAIRRIGDLPSLTRGMSGTAPRVPYSTRATFATSMMETVTALFPLPRAPTPAAAAAAGPEAGGRPKSGAFYHGC